jgi:putative transposase
MPRRARLAVAGIPWHIIQRGHNRSTCFFADDDRHIYLELLQQQAERFGCAIHAYCLMTNHVHLLLTPEHAYSPSLMMKHLSQRYVQHINRAYKRSGTLWEGRFKSCLAQDERYVLTCYRYIELNPVRAQMVEAPEHYHWSSFLRNGMGHTNALITPHVNYLGLGASTVERCTAYHDLVINHNDQQSITLIRRATQGNYVLGDKEFEKEIELTLGRRVVPGQSGRPAQTD